MYVIAPPSLPAEEGKWLRGVRVKTPVESVDLFVTLADLAGLPLPRQALGGETLRPLLLPKGAVAPRKKAWALSQWARRPSCTRSHGCLDGHGNPWQFEPDQAIMGYKLRTVEWAFIAWVHFDFGEDGDPAGKATTPDFSKVSALELYTHVGDTGDLHSGETYEWENLAYEPEHQTTVKELMSNLELIVKQGLVKPMLPKA